jgi:5-(carboxyamino)imidazole ribonucleotide mutase
MESLTPIANPHRQSPSPIPIANHDRQSPSRSHIPNSSFPRHLYQMTSTPLVGVIMGSASDYEHLAPACEMLDQFGVPYEKAVVSAHRTPDWMFEYASTAEARGLMVIIAAAGGAAHLPGMVASKTLVPVLGVPVPATALNGVDALLSIVQMPAGIPVGTLAIGKPGASNAGILAAEIVGTSHPEVRDRIRAWREQRTASVREQKLP